MQGSPELLIAGFAVGLMIGLTSMGGAALMTPFLVLILGMKPSLAIGSDLVYAAITKFVGGWVHWRQGTVDVNLAKRLAYGSVPGGLMGVLCITVVREKISAEALNLFLRRSIGITLTVVAAIILIRTLWGARLQMQAHRFHRRQSEMTIIWGALVGFTVGLTSIGSGSLLMPFLALLYPLAPATMVGTDVFHACILLSVTGVLHWGAGNVDWPLVLWLLAGSLPGVYLGSRLAPVVPDRLLKVGLSLTLFTAGAFMVPK
jgi:uncharacterized membrane protein YfcA